jgi:hypothetical protein
LAADVAIEDVEGDGDDAEIGRDDVEGDAEIGRDDVSVSSTV